MNCALRGPSSTPGLLATILSLLLLALTPLLFASCAATEKKEPEAKELTASSSKSVDIPEEELLETAKQQYASGLISIAHDQFVSLKDTYPSGPYAELAEIKAADASFELNNFAEAASSYEEFVRSHPTSPTTPYATLRAGRSLHLSARGPGRDVSPIEKANEWYDKVMKKYPDSPYAGAARQLKQDALGVLAEHQRYVSSFYSNHAAEEAAREREKEASQHDALARNLSSPLAVRRVQRVALYKAGGEAKNRPNIKLVRRLSPGQVAMARLGTIRGDQRASLLGSDRSLQHQLEPASAGLRRVLKIDCQLGSPGQGNSRGNPRRVLLYLSSAFDEEEFLREFGRVSFPSGVFALALPNTTAQPKRLDCFSQGDLEITDTGELRISNTGEAILMSLDNPPRLLVSIRPARVK